MKTIIIENNTKQRDSNIINLVYLHLNACECESAFRADYMRLFNDHCRRFLITARVKVAEGNNSVIYTFEEYDEYVDKVKKALKNEV